MHDFVFEVTVAGSSLDWLVLLANVSGVWSEVESTNLLPAGVFMTHTVTLGHMFTESGPVSWAGFVNDTGGIFNMTGNRTLVLLPTTTTTTSTTTSTTLGGGGGGGGGGSNPPNLPRVHPCYNGVQDVGEDGVDCGGQCEPCMTCSDGVMNQGEDGVDCGGPCPPCTVPTTTSTTHATTTSTTLVQDSGVSDDAEDVDSGGQVPGDITPSTTTTLVSAGDAPTGYAVFYESIRGRFWIILLFLFFALLFYIAMTARYTKKDAE